MARVVLGKNAGEPAQPAGVRIKLSVAIRDAAGFREGLMLTASAVPDGGAAIQNRPIQTSTHNQSAQPLLQVRNASSWSPVGKPR